MSDDNPALADARRAIGLANEIVLAGCDQGPGVHELHLSDRDFELIICGLRLYGRSLFAQARAANEELPV